MLVIVSANLVYNVKNAIKDQNYKSFYIARMRKHMEGLNWGEASVSRWGDLGVERWRRSLVYNHHLVCWGVGVYRNHSPGLKDLLTLLESNIFLIMQTRLGIFHPRSDDDSHKSESQKATFS